MGDFAPVEEEKGPGSAGALRVFWAGMHRVAAPLLSTTLALVASVPLVLAPGAEATTTALTGGDDHSFAPAVSASGDLVAFASLADDLPGATGASVRRQIFVADRTAGTFVRVTNGNSDSLNAEISPNGDWIVFDSFASNLTAGDTNGTRDVFRYHRPSNTLVRVTDGNAASQQPRVADNGTVIFHSLATDLVAGDPDATTNDDLTDVYLWNGAAMSKITGETPFDYRDADISGDGTTIAYIHDNPAGDPNHSYGDLDVYVAPVGATAQFLTAAGNYPSDQPHLSYDGATIAFRSAANSLPGAPGGIGRNVIVWDGTNGFRRVTNSNNQSIVALDLSQNASTVTFATAENLTGDPYPGVQTFRAVVGSGTVTLLTDGVNDTSPSINGDGTMVAYLDGNSPRQIQVWLDTTTPTTTTPTTTAPTTTTAPSGPSPILSPRYWSTSGTEARIARLYAAFFLRDPDPAGYAFWQDRISTGQWSNDSAATFFGTSPEFVSRYGNSLSDEAFVTLLYQNTLSRSPDAEGLQYWLGRLAAGDSRGTVALGFSDAPEFRSITRAN